MSDPPAMNPIAIVGVGCKVPGADNVQDFWRVLLHGENHVTDIPPSRWNMDAFYDPDPNTPGKGYARKAGLVSQPEEFDNKVYGINDFEAAQMDPQQRFVLDCSLMALQDAGITRASLAGSCTGVFIGVSNSDYRVLFRGNSCGVSNQTVTGISNSIIAARLSYVYDLRGPSLVLDTACSSSLIGIHLACQAIRAGDCSMAIAGGTNYLTLPDVFVHLSKAGMMSPSGQCHAFGSGADGYVRGEGCGIVILKPLKDAERDGDRVWATIYTGSNQDGHSVSPLTAPSGSQQRSLLTAVARHIALDLDRVDYIEAHGTGTSAGDPVEAKALGEFFLSRPSESDRPPRYVGSVKTNIGHLESAAGVVGVIKVLLMMKHNIIVPSLHCEEANPQINFTELRLTVPGKPVNWENPDKVAYCNSFGFGGSNSHAVICQYTKRENPVLDVAVKSEMPCVVALSACTDKSLRAMAQELRDEVALGELHVHDLSLTSTARRDHYPVRVAHVVTDLLELADALDSDLNRPQVGRAVYTRPKVTYVFGGMGTCWAGMCRELMEHLPVFSHAVLQVEAELKGHVEWSLVERLHEDFDPQDPLFSPIAIFACQVALAAVWRDLGLEAQCIVGQSVGEVGAAHVAGCLTLGEAVRVVYHRSRLLATLTTGGRMMVVRNVPVTKTREVVTRHGQEACISLIYSPMACCVSVSQDSFQQLRDELNSCLYRDHKALQLTELPVPVAYHSPHVHPCMAPLREALAGLQGRPPVVPLVSSVTGLPLTEAPDAEYWVSNLRQPVLFQQAVSQTRTSPSRQLFVEMGPKPVLKAHLADIFPQADVMAVTSMSKPPEVKVFLQALTSVYEYGAEVQWARLPTRGTTVTDLPRYVFDKKKNLLTPETGTLWLAGVDEGRMNHPFVFPLHTPHTFKVLISPLLLSSVYDHVVGGRVLVPGAVYAEVGLAVARYLTHSSGQQWAVSVHLDQAVSVPKDGYQHLDIALDDRHLDLNDPECSVPFSVCKDGRAVAHVRISPVRSDSPSDLVNVQHVRASCQDKVNKEVIYSALRQAGFMYGETFTQLEDAYASDKECLCTLRVHPTVLRESPGMALHPAILDCMLQSSLIITGRAEGGGGGRSKGLLPRALGRVLVHRPPVPTMLVHTQLKAMGVKQHLYNLKLLTPGGAVVAELDDLVINLILETEDNHLEHLYLPTWTHVRPLPPPGGAEEEEEGGGEILVLTDQSLAGSGVSGKVKVMEVGGMDFRHGMLASVEQFIASNRSTTSALAVLWLQPMAENVDAERVEADIVNRSFLYKELLALANRLSLSVPLYLCTCNAWPSPSARDLDLPVNPAATALWGMCRAVVTERIYPDTRCVDLHLPPDTLTPAVLATLMAILHTCLELSIHAELLVNSEGIYVNQICPVDPSTPLPLFRANTMDPKEPALLLSQEASAVVAPHAVLCDLATMGRGDHEVTCIQAQAFALQSSSLTKLKMQYQRLDQNHAKKTSGCPVFAVEVIGSVQRSTAQNGKTQKPTSQTDSSQTSSAQKRKTATTHSGKTPKPATKKGKTPKLKGKTQKGEAPSLADEACSGKDEGDAVVSCYPVAMGTQVSVPTSVTLPTSLLPGYQSGDLTRLVLLFELHTKVASPTVTILTSSTSQPYAEVLQELFRGRRHGKTPYVINVVTADQLHALQSPLHDTVISLVLLDEGLMASLLDSWDNTKTLITCSGLLQSDALSCASCFAQDLDLVTVDTQLLFHPSGLKRLVPRVGQWLRERGRESRGGVASILSCLHQDPASCEPDSQLDLPERGSARDLRDMLHFRTCHTSGLHVHVTKEQLFRQDCLYLVVGGLSGLGWLCVEYLAENHAGHIAIVNRRQPSPQHLHEMAALSARHSCHVTAFQADVTSLSSLTSALKQMETTFPGAALKGIFFGAAVTADKSFLAMDVPGFQSALSPKVRGTWNLHALTHTLPLDYFVMHSSIASVLGNAGQANYAAGNAFMDGLAHRRRQKGLAAQTINWGVLDLGILKGNDSAREMLESRGFLLLAAGEISDLLTPVLMVNWPQCVAMKLDREKLSHRMYREGSTTLLSRLKPLLSPSPSSQDAQEDLLHLVHLARSSSPAERVKIYEHYLQVLVSRVLSVEVSSVTPEVSLLDLGMDSVGAMTLITQIHRDTAKRLTAVQLLTGHPTVLSVAEAIIEAPEEEGGEEDGENGTLRMEEVEEEEDGSSEASLVETSQLTLYGSSPQPTLFHIVVDIPLQTQPDLSDIESAANAALTLHPSARTTFTEVRGSSGVTFRRSLLPEVGRAEVRVVETDGGAGDDLSCQSREKFELSRCGPVRFLLVQGPRAFLRLVLHKVAFDCLSASPFAQDVASCLESGGSVPVAREPEAPDVQWRQRLREVWGDEGARGCVQDYWDARLAQAPLPSTAFSWGHRVRGGERRGEEVEKVEVGVTGEVVRRVKAFIQDRNLSLLGFLASCHQVTLHALTGHQTIPLLFPLDLRKVHDGVIGVKANCCSELPLLADFGANRSAREAMTVERLVEQNDAAVMQDIQHGVLPLSLLEPLSAPLQSVLAAVSHGITIDQVAPDYGYNDVTSSSSPKKLNGKRGWRFTAPQGPAILPLHLDTNLTIRHFLPHDTLTLTLTFKRSALDQVRGRVLLTELMLMVMRVLTQPTASLSKLAQRGQKLRRQLEKPGKKAGKC